MTSTINSDEQRGENSLRRSPQEGPIHAPILCEPGIDVEVQRCNRGLWSGHSRKWYTHELAACLF